MREGVGSLFAIQRENGRLPLTFACVVEIYNADGESANPSFFRVMIVSPFSDKIRSLVLFYFGFLAGRRNLVGASWFLFPGWI